MWKTICMGGGLLRLATKVGNTLQKRCLGGPEQARTFAMLVLRVSLVRLDNSLLPLSMAAPPQFVGWLTDLASGQPLDARASRNHCVSKQAFFRWRARTPTVGLFSGCLLRNGSSAHSRRAH